LCAKYAKYVQKKSNPGERSWLESLRLEGGEKKVWFSVDLLTRADAPFPISDDGLEGFVHIQRDIRLFSLAVHFVSTKD
jgi:hypothetical protein